MATTAAQPLRLNGSLHSRRRVLDDLHSYLRSVDNLRPDEALDEIAKLLDHWSQFRTLDAGEEIAGSLLSVEARRGATARLEPVLADVRPGDAGDLFQELVGVGVRAGMGQYFTPAPVAEAMATYLRPEPQESWLDPFCGSGLLLGSVALRCAGELALFGVDRDPRVLRLARVEAVLHHPASVPHLVHGNALEDPASLLARLGAPSEGVDGIVANPPFGAEVHETDRERYADFTLAAKGKTPLEVLGLEQCVRLLRPGGRLGIVLPQSVLSNRSLARVREFVLATCRIDAVLSLPPETFLPFRGVGKASVLFVTKGVAARAGVRVGVARSIGWDPTGKPLGASDVHATVELMARDGVEAPERIATIPQRPELARNLTAEWLLRPAIDGVRLGDLCSAIFTGRSPGRAAYEDADAGDDCYRVLKVGDLTNHGVDWTPGERSVARLKRPPEPGRLVQLGDLATTAAAHHPRYIAAKVDFVDCLPDGFGARCFPVAEVLLMRPRPELVDPLILLLWLRSAHGRRSVQSCVTGQTAHLNAEDVADVVVPDAVLRMPTDCVLALQESLRLRRRSEREAAQAAAAFEADLPRSRH